jgi:uncharacterized protein YbbK (DUF523 family)
MAKLLVSACLLGDPVRYDGRSKALKNDKLGELLKQNRVVRFCPEVAGGLSVPRDAAEIQQGDGFSVIAGQSTVSTLNGNNVTNAFISGADKALELCRQHRIKVAILTESSPSCGSHQIYDGSFTGQSRAGVGVTTALLRGQGISVFSQHQIDDAIKHLA